MKFTKWFLSSEHTPVRVGVYQIGCSNFRAYSRWNGKDWCYSAPTIQGAADTFGSSTLMDIAGMRWRGILK